MLNAEQLKEVEHLAGLFYTPKQIAIMIEVDIKEFQTKLHYVNDVYKAYWKGVYEADMEFRTSVKRLANLGSSPAQTLLAKLIEQHKLDSIDR